MTDDAEKIAGGGWSYDQDLILIPTEEAIVECKCGHKRVIHGNGRRGGKLYCYAPACADGCCHCLDCDGFEAA